MNHHMTDDEAIVLDGLASWVRDKLIKILDPDGKRPVEEVAAQGREIAAVFGYAIRKAGNMSDAEAKRMLSKAAGIATEGTTPN